MRDDEGEHSDGGKFDFCKDLGEALFEDQLRMEEKAEAYQA